MIVAILILLALAVGYSKEDEQDSYRRDAATANEGHTIEQFGTPRAGVPAIAEAFVSNPEPKDGDEREKRDLAAQEGMAVWAYWMAVFAGLTTIITLGGTLLIWRQVVLTTEAVKDTGNATKAMVRQNELTEAAQRPWVTVEVRPKRLGINGGIFAFEAEARFANLGASAAINANTAVCYHFLKGNYPSEYKAILDKMRDDLRVPSSAHIVPNEVIPRLINVLEDVSEMYFVEDEGKKTFFLLIVATAQYRSTLRPNEWLESSRAYLLNWRDKKGFVHSLIKDTSILLDEGRLSMEILPGEIVT
ncbi:hypothetical protein WAB17_03625 [Parerythrobacter aurantius]|uniref:hypothetical protein n=1 Tax=Parerythrobacter aurantius TaxID=3127706 RepID=UPI00324BDC40